MTIKKEKFSWISFLLLIEHYIDRSSISGLGVFAAAAAVNGQKLWEYNPLIDIVISKNEINLLPPHMKAWVLERGEFYPASDHFILGADGDQFMNHSDDPNIFSDGTSGFAARNITIGEELTCDYRQCLVLGANLSLMGS